MSLLQRKVLPRPGKPTRMMISFCRSGRFRGRREPVPTDRPLRLELPSASSGPAGTAKSGGGPSNSESLSSCGHSIQGLRPDLLLVTVGSTPNVTVEQHDSVCHCIAPAALQLPGSH